MKKKYFVKKDFSSHMNKYIDSIQTDGSVEDYWNILKGALLEGTDWSYGWKKGPVRHKKICWWNDDVSNSVCEHIELWKEWKQENTSIEKK